MTNRIPGNIPRVLYKDIEFLDKYEGYFYERTRATVEDAQEVSSEMLHSSLHAPVLDLDVPVELVPSSTSGHAHLYIDIPMSWRQYKRLLKALGNAGVLEKNYVKMCLVRKRSDVRVP